MPKRTARQIRLDTMREVREKDAAKGRRVNRPDRPALERWPGRKKETVQKQVRPEPVCCMVKHEGTLPSNFRKCYNCILDNYTDP